jgi:hypothetical protein
VNRVSRTLLWALLLALIARLWVQPLTSSYWVDEMATAFIVDHPHDLSLNAVPQLQNSLYYPVLAVSEQVFGKSELAGRLPSFVLSLGLLALLAALARKLIGNGAEWPALFTCFGLKLLNFLAVDTRPYAMGMLVAAATVFFLIRWFDAARWWDGALFVVCATALWRIHLIFWPFYLALAIYSAARLARRQTKLAWWQVAAGFTAVGLLLLPVARSAVLLAAHAKDHVIIVRPTLQTLAFEMKLQLVLEYAAGAWILSRILGCRAPAQHSRDSAGVLIAAWWLCPPLSLFAYSWVTGNSVFLSRYLCLALPGIALLVAYLIWRFIPSQCLASVSVAIGLVVLITVGDWRHAPQHSGSRWREAAQAVNLAAGDNTVVICPSPFIEAKGPEWTPNYRLPGFLYSYLAYYPVRGAVRKFPFEPSREAEQYARSLLPDLAQKRTFLIYGSRGGTQYWQRWFPEQAELAGWSTESLGNFGDVFVFRMASPSGASGPPRTNSR